MDYGDSFTELAVTQRRWRLSEALSAAQLAPRASLYAPLAPPVAPAALPHIRWRAGDAFHAAALLAAVADMATLPYRLNLHAPPGPLGPPLGTCDMHSLVQLLVLASLEVTRVALACRQVNVQKNLQRITAGCKAPGRAVRRL